MFYIFFSYFKVTDQQPYTSSNVYEENLIDENI